MNNIKFSLKLQMRINRIEGINSLLFNMKATKKSVDV
jgi:hypothetical protein